MRILYFSDSYAWNVMGTKRSIYEELKKRGHVVIFQPKTMIKDILRLAKTYNSDQVWIAHSFIVLSPDVKKRLEAPIIGFGFSDPYKFTESRLSGYDAYITNHYETFQYLRAKMKIPIHYNPTACDFRFHKRLNLQKDIDISCIGVGEHPHFKNKRERIDIITRLRNETDFNIQVYGNGWPAHPNNHNKIEGQEFLNVINRSRVGLDIQDDFSPMAHRMFEYSACGTPVITRKRAEVERFFLPDEEIMFYESYDDLKKLLIVAIREPAYLESTGHNARTRCLKEHDVSNRVKNILDFLKDNI